MTGPVFTDLAEAVRAARHVCIVGSATTPGAQVPSGTLALQAPSGIVAHVPDELVITALAGTPVAEIAEVLAGAGQRLRLPVTGTLGGGIATRRNGLYSMSNATLPNTVLMTRSVSGRGEVFVTGGPTVKNVSGFDLNKVLTGSWGIFALVAEVSLRVEPLPACTRWFTGRGPDAFASVAALYRPAVAHVAGDKVTVCLEGHPDDVADQASLLRDCTEIAAPAPDDHLAAVEARSSVPSIGGSGPEAAIVRRLKTLFDPDGKMNAHLTSTTGGEPS